jgi:V/A-type H+-transporting ATPase subunit I
MLTPARMKRVNLFILEKDEPEVTRALGELKTIHLVPAAETDVPLAPRPQQDRHVDEVRQLLLHVERLLTQLGLEAEGPEAALPHKTPAEIADRLHEIEVRADEASRLATRCETERTQLESMIRSIESFVGLGVPIERLNEFSFLHFAIGSMPETSLGELEAKVGENVVLLPRRSSGDRQRIVAVTSKKGRFALETALEHAGFQPEPPGESMTGLAEQLKADADRQIDRVEVQRDMAERTLKELAVECGPELRTYRRTLINELRIIEARVNFAYTETACYITGWVPADQVNQVTEVVLGKTGGRAAIEIYDPPPGSEPPSKFTTHPLLRPFAMLVAGYGFPKYREIEPTLFVAVTFLAMFGFMFGDVGHGLVLAVIGLLVRRKGRKEKTRDIGTIFLACGLASMIMGVVYGSYFGLTLENTGQAWMRPLWQEPFGENSNPLMTLEVAVVGGAAMISIGLIFNIINRLRNGDFLHGIFDRVGLVGALMYWAVLWVALKALVFGPENLPVGPMLGIIAIGVVVLFIREPLLVFLKRRRGESAENLGEAIITACVEVMEVFIGYLANSLSFLRLAAYAFSHAALLLATFEMSRVLADLPTVGKPLAVVMFVVGNVIIIVLEGLVAAIQAVRLEYYEFFGKFFSGNGRAYRPFEVE